MVKPPRFFPEAPFCARAIWKYRAYLLLLCASGCGPIYSTEYKFFPPKDPRSSYCIQQCESDADRCRQYQSAQHDSCEYENQRLMNECNYQIQQSKGRGPKWHECGRQLSCDFPETRCISDFHNCYRYCGGTVIEEKVCVANCEEINNPAQNDLKKSK